MSPRPSDVTGSGRPDHRGRRGAVSRRHFLVGAGVTVAGTLAVSACTGGSTAATTPTSVTTVDGGTGTSVPILSGDAKVAALAASLEVLAVSTYQAGLAAAAANKLGLVPPALITYVTTAVDHHQAALERWNALLTAGGAPGVNQPPATLKTTIDTMLARATDATALARVALVLEQTASDTYFSVVPTLQSKDVITLAAQLQVVDQEHAAILHYILGVYPVPDAFQNANMAIRD